MEYENILINSLTPPEMTKEKIYEEMIQLLEYIKSKKRIADFCYDNRYQYSYISALVNQTIRSDTGKPRKGYIESNKEIIKLANKFIRKENI